MGRSFDSNYDDPVQEDLDFDIDADWGDMDDFIGVAEDPSQFDETEFRDRVIQELMSSIEEFLTFSTKEELQVLIDSQFNES